MHAHNTLTQEDSPEVSRPHYNRGVSYHTPPVRTAYSARSRDSKLYKRPAKTSDSPIFRREVTPQNSLQRFLSKPTGVDVSVCACYSSELATDAAVVSSLQTAELKELNHMTLELT